MRMRQTFGIYNVLENILKKSEAPMTCVDLFDNPDVKKFADAVPQVSDYLGHMYRRGLLGREPAPKTMGSQARWGYFWKNRSEIIVPKTVHPEEIQVPAMSAIHATPRSVLSKPNIEISDNGGTVVIDLPELTITIRSKT